VHRFSLSVVVPCLNEEDNIEPVYREIVEELDRYDELEILFVDDGSTDATLQRIQALARDDTRVSYLSFTRNYGIEPAFSAGYRYARHDWILHLDADLQFPPAEAHRLVAAAQAGYDAAFAIRVDRKDHWTRRTSSLVHDFIARRLLGIELPAGATTFRLVRADLARKVVDLHLGTPYFLATVPRLTNNWTVVPTAHRPRERGQPKVRFRGLAKHAMELFVSFSDRPMALTVSVSVLGSSIAILAAVLAIAGFSVLALTDVALAAGLLALAVIGRYLIHIANGQARPPSFLIREANVPIEPGDRLGAVSAPRTERG
jgi:polyisoprenyl-phosphate glycosyltransferase